jgi:hypothetical protein
MAIKELSIYITFDSPEFSSDYTFKMHKFNMLYYTDTALQEKNSL